MTEKWTGSGPKWCRSRSGPKWTVAGPLLVWVAVQQPGWANEVDRKWTAIHISHKTLYTTRCAQKFREHVQVRARRSKLTITSGARYVTLPAVTTMSGSARGSAMMTAALV